MIALFVAVAGSLNSRALVSGVLKELRTPKDKRRAVLSSVYRARSKLIQAGLICYENGFVRLTDFGAKSLDVMKANNFQFAKPKKWDKKWRILIFDIREERKGLRDKLRKTLVSIGFVRLQDSVWVYPYDCEDLITLLKADFKIGKDVLYIIADEIENDRAICDYFGLNR